MPRFFLPSDRFAPEPKPGDEIRITGGDAFHIYKVLRMKPGDRITVCDMKKNEYECRISGLSASTAVLTVCRVQSSENEPDVGTTLFQAILKGDKMETVIQKAVELGVAEIVPVLADRSVARLDRSNTENKLARWNKIALEASKQCGRGVVPAVSAPIGFDACLDRLAGFDTAFLCYEGERDRSIRTVLAGHRGESIGFYIGPEGGISPAELSRIGGKIPVVSIGALILRAETASAAVLSMILYQTQL